jgi:hypothetical protein
MSATRPLAPAFTRAIGPFVEAVERLGEERSRPTEHSHESPIFR